MTNLERCGVVIDFPTEPLPTNDQLKSLHSIIDTFRGTREVLEWGGQRIFKVTDDGGRLIGYQAVILPPGAVYNKQFVNTSDYPHVSVHDLLSQ